jgi:TRAP-type C4-dicarboxylate transport system permease large subunit
MTPNTQPTGAKRLLNEPVMLAAISQLVVILIGVFGFQLSAEEIAALASGLLVIVGIVTRQLVTPNQLAEARVDEGKRPTDSRT